MRDSIKPLNLTKLLSLVLLFLSLSLAVLAQTEQQIIPGNRSVTGLDHNILFRAGSRYTVTQTGNPSALLNVESMFDGKLPPYYTSQEPTISIPTVITISGLPVYHRQSGAWIGWTTRGYPPSKFKIEVKRAETSALWTTVCDVENYTGYSYMAIPPSLDAENKTLYIESIRFTFYDANSPVDRLGVSELFYIHPEAVSAYEGLAVKYSNNGDVIMNEGEVGIGTNSIPPGYRLAVNGKIIATEIKVETGWADYVFHEDYELKSLSEVSSYIEENHHLPGIPTAEEVAENGIKLGEMNAKLLEKIEELTLYLIEMKMESEEMKEENRKIKSRLEKLEKVPGL